MQNFLSRKHAFFRLPLFKLRAYAEGVTDEDEYGSMLTVRECHRPASAHQQLPLASASAICETTMPSMSFTRRAEWESGEGRGRCDGEGQREEDGERESKTGT